MIPTRMLVIDDEKDFCQVIKSRFAKKGFIVEYCLSGEEAFVTLQKCCYDIVLCDVVMPFYGLREGGLEIAKIIAERQPACFTVIISGHVTETLVNRAMETIPSKRYRFLTKGTPSLSKQLMEIIAKEAGKKRVFVCMPFDEGFNDLYLFGIKEAATELGLECARADEIQHAGGLIDKTYDLIRSSHILVADMSSRNPNVFYEVGYAHGLGREVILIATNEADIPTDLKKYLHILHGGSISNLKAELKKRIEALC
jgi:CheY-like chemotaxis protein